MRHARLTLKQAVIRNYAGLTNTTICSSNSSWFTVHGLYPHCGVNRNQSPCAWPGQVAPLEIVQGLPRPWKKVSSCRGAKACPMCVFHTHTHTRAEGPQIRGPIILPVVSATSKLVQQTTAVNIVSFNNHRSSISKSSMRQTAEVLSYQIPPLIPRSYANYYRHSHQKDCRICISALATWVSSNYPILWVPAVGHSSHVSEHA